MIEQLQFIRPDWFYAFVPLAIFILLMLRRHGSSMSWKAVCDAQLLPHILTKGTGKSSRFPLILATFAASLCIVAAAGPVFKKLPQPVFREQSALVILMDLSQSMDATDIRPSRLERAKLKLLDILKSRKGGQTALIAFAANAFVVTPLTDDTNTITNLVPTLQTQLMPAQGSHAYIAINKASELLQQAGVNSGDALLITDGTSSSDIEAINTFNTAGHRLSILGVGTIEGGPVPLNGGFLQDNEGAIVIPKLFPRQLQQAALKGGGLYASMTANDSDIERLNKLFSSKKTTTESKTATLSELKLTADIWQEEGPWLLLLVIPIVALWSRKGWLMSVSVVVLTFSVTLPEPAYAISLEHLWSSNDQKAMRAFNEGDIKTAAEQFENNRWKSSAHYRAGDYEKSLEALKEPVNSNDFYNKGNALAKLGRYPEAIKAYDEAIALDAGNEDASYNRELVKKEMQNQQSDQSQNGQQQDAQQNEQSEDDQNQSGQQQDQQQSADGSNESDQNNQQQNDSASQEKNDAAEQNQQAQKDQNQSSEQDNNEETARQALEDAQQQASEKAQKDSNNKQDDESLAMSETTANESSSEKNQAIEQWLKRIPDDPGQLLRRKFEYQYKRMPNQNADDQPW